MDGHRLFWAIGPFLPEIATRGVRWACELNRRHRHREDLECSIVAARVRQLVLWRMLMIAVTAIACGLVGVTVRRSSGFQHGARLPRRILLTAPRGLRLLRSRLRPSVDGWPFSRLYLFATLFANANRGSNAYCTN